MVRMTAKAIVSMTSEPARARAIDLVLLGHLLAASICATPSSSFTVLYLAQLRGPSGTFFCLNKLLGTADLSML